MARVSSCLNARRRLHFCCRLTHEHTKQAELPSRSSGTVDRSLPCLHSKHRWGMTVRTKPAQQPCQRRGRRARLLPDAWTHPTARDVRRPAPHHPEVRLANANWQPTPPRHRTREGPKSNRRRPQGPRTTPGTPVAASPFVQVADASGLLDRVVDGVGAVVHARGRVHARDVLSYTRAGVDSQHLVNQLVLTKIDVSVGDRKKECLKDGAGVRVVSREERSRCEAQMLADVRRVCEPHTSRSVRERTGIVDDSRRRAIRFPASVSSRCSSSSHQRVDRCSSLLVLQFAQHGVHERAQLGRGPGLEGCVEIRINGLNATRA